MHTRTHFLLLAHFLSAQHGKAKKKNDFISEEVANKKRAVSGAYLEITINLGQTTRPYNPAHSKKSNEKKI